MSHLYVMSDPHFGHRGILNLPGRTGMFQSIDDHDAALIANWNKVITERDTVWLLGDLTMHKSGYFRHVIAPQLTGNIKVVMGNHDEPFHDRVYTRTGEAVQFNGVKVLNLSGKRGAVVLTHIPIHPQEFYRWRFNIHGHLHHKVVYEDYKWAGDKEGIVGTKPDLRYINVSAEQVGFTPQRLDDVIDRRINEMENGS